jgi:single-stranded-DNA-specific exonuclease
MIQGTKYRWLIARSDRQTCHDIVQATSLPWAIVHALVARGFQNAQQIQDFIWTPHDSVLADPECMLHARKAVDRILLAVQNHEKILIAGDYDVDGMTSTSLLMLCLRAIGAQVNFFLPHRLKDGYGLSCATVEKAKNNGFTLIVTVDNGITAFEAGARAKELGLDLIITDHHRPRADQVPQAYALVNPHQANCPYPFKDFAGVGVAFKCMQLLYRLQQRELPDQAYELLALGTIADVVPLRGENRYWVQEGLRRMRATPTMALQYMLHNAALSDKDSIGSRDVGFSIAPQLNALGRLDDPRAAVGFLLGARPETMDDIAQRLKALNEERKRIEQQVLHEVISQLEREQYVYKTDPIIIMHGTNWPAGVIGLVAGKLMHQYGVPVIILCGSSAGALYKGSCRAPAWCNIIDLLQEVKDELAQFGGHPAAAGLSIHAHRLESFSDRMRSIVRVYAQGKIIGPILACDAPLLISDITAALGHALQALEPFGATHAEPVFYIARATILQPPQLLKEQHVKVLVYDDGMAKPVIFFKRPDLYPWLQERVGQYCRLAAQISVNQWQGQTRYELLGLDIASYEDIEN